MYDIAIIGAGPAGLSTALSLMIHLKEDARDNVSVIIIDKDKVPGRNKPCGGMIIHRALEILPDLYSISSRDIYGVRIFYNDFRYEVNFNEIVAINVNREALSNFFISKLRGKFDFSLGERVSDVSFVGDKVVIKTSDKIIYSRLVVGADGVNSLVRRLFFNKSAKKDEMGIAYQVQLRMKEEEIKEKFNGFNEFYYGKLFSPGGYSWIFPHRDRVKIGVGAVASMIKHNLSDYIKRIMNYRKINDLEIVREEIYPVPLSGGLSRVVNKRVVLVGDAAHQVEPLSGAGIHLAIANGFLLGLFLSKALLRGKLKLRYLKRYENAWSFIRRRELLLQRILVKILLKHGSRFIKNGSTSSKMIREFSKILIGKSDSFKLIKQWFLSRIPIKR